MPIFNCLYDRRISASCLGLIALLLLSDLAYSQNAGPEPVTPPPGVRVDLGGCQLHYITKGSGSYPVVFFHGAGDVALKWNLVLPKVSTFTQAVAIDEHGSGWSEFGHLNHTLAQQAYDSYRLLKKSGINGPYILVGHSRGGLVVQQFARMFMDQVAAVVLVDSSHPDFMLRYRQPDGTFKWQKSRDRAQGVPVPDTLSAPIPEDREYQSFPMQRDVSESYGMFSEEDQELFHRAYNRTVHVPKGLKTYFSDELQMMYEHRADYHLGGIPLVVISAGIRSAEGDESYSEAELIAHSNALQKDLLTLSDNSRHIIARESTHSIQIDQPEVIVSAIRAVFDALP